MEIEEIIKNNKSKIINLCLENKYINGNKNHKNINIFIKRADVLGNMKFMSLIINSSIKKEMYFDIINDDFLKQLQAYMNIDRIVFETIGNKKTNKLLKSKEYLTLPQYINKIEKNEITFNLKEKIISTETEIQKLLNNFEKEVDSFLDNKILNKK